MTDLETALKAQLAEWRSQKGKNIILGGIDHYPERGRADYVYLTIDELADDLEKLLDEHEQTDPEVKQLVAQMEDAT